MYEDDDELIDDECPRCSYGRIQVKAKPFLKFHHKHLFTIPDAVCYQCDSCGYYEFDDSNYDIINEMLDGAISPAPDTKSSQILPAIPPEDDLPDQRKFPSA